MLYHLVYLTCNSSYFVRVERLVERFGNVCYLPFCLVMSGVVRVFLAVLVSALGSPASLVIRIGFTVPL